MYNKDLFFKLFIKDRDIKESLQSYIYIMQSICTAAIALPALSASTGIFREVHDISLPFSTGTEDTKKGMTSLYSMKPYQNIMQNTVASLIKTSFGILEQHYRVSPLTLCSAAALSGLHSFDRMMDEGIKNHANLSKKRQPK